jgi:tetratricopeptide (TPR) repeat protein
MSFEAVEAYARRTLELATRAGAKRAQALAWCLLGEALLLRGQWPEAEDALSRSAALHQGLRSPTGAALTRQRLAELTIYRGQRGAEEHLAQGFELAKQSLLAAHLMGRLYATAALEALDQGDAARAAATVEEASKAAERYGTCAACSALLYPVGAAAYAQLAQVETARQYAQAAAEVAERWQSQSWQAMANYARGAAARSEGELEEARRQFLAAAATFEQIGQVFDMARCLLEAGRVDLDGNRAAEERRALLQRARTLFHELGARAAEARAASELATLSAR